MPKTLTTILMGSVVLIQLVWHSTFASGLDPLGTMRPTHSPTETYYLPLVWQNVNLATPVPLPTASPIAEVASLTPTLSPTATPSAGNSTPTASPSPTITPTPIPEWLIHFNSVRATAGLPLVTENREWSEANALHARYMVKNNVLIHSEESRNRWYSEAGAAAASASNLWVSGRTEVTATTVINNWIVAPFHGIAMLDPQLQQVGYGEYREEDGGVQLGAGIDVQRGISYTLSPSTTFPLMFPPNGATSPFTSFNGEEFPNPFSNCPGFVAPVGAPIYLQLGTGELRPDMGAHTLTVNGKLVPHCIFDETTYRNRDAGEQSVGRMILDGRDAIVMLPRKPFPPGATVTVAISANGTVHTWDFIIAEAPPPPTPLP